MNQCIYCGVDVPAPRIELGYDYCVTCSDSVTVPKAACQVFGHKTAGEIMIYHATPENKRQVRRANERRR